MLKDIKIKIVNLEVDYFGYDKKDCHTVDNIEKVNGLMLQLMNVCD